MALDPSEVNRRLLLRATTLLTQATAFHKAGALRTALDPLEEALAILRGLDDCEKQAHVLHFKGLVHYDLKQSKEAVRYYNQALKIRRQFGYGGEGATLFNLGLAHEDLGHLNRANRCYREALVIFRRNGEHEAIEAAREALSEGARTLNRTGVALFETRKLRKAASTFQQAVQIAREVELSGKELSRMLKNMGDTYKDLAQFAKALQCYEEALAIRKTYNDDWGEGEALHHIGAIYQDLGDFQQALGYYNEALEKRRKASDQAGENTTLNNLGLIYHTLGDRGKALRLYQERLVLVRKLGDRSGEATTLNNIGGAHNELGQLDEALQYYQEALAIRRELGDRGGELAILLNLGSIYNLLDQPEQALSLELEGLKISEEISNPQFQARTLHSLGSTLLTQKMVAEARGCLEKALAIRRKLGLRQEEAITRTTLAVLYEELGHTNKAAAHLNKAVQIIEQKRFELLEEEMRSSYFTTVRYIYELQVSLSIKAGQTAQAFHAAEQSKARTFLDLLSEARVNIRQGLDPVLQQEEQRLLGELRNLRQRLRDLGVNTEQKQEPALIAQLKRQDEIERAYELNQAEIRRRNPRYASFTQPETWSLARIQDELLDENTALLEYVLHVQSCFLFVVLKHDVRVFSLPPKEEIETKARELRKAVSDKQQRTAGDFEVYQRNRYPHAFELYEALIKPAEDLINDKQLLIVTDGELHYLPFALLLTEPPEVSVSNKNAEAQSAATESTSTASTSSRSIGNQSGTPITFAALPYLMRRHSIAYAPSASVAALLKSEHDEHAQSWRQELVAFADPLHPNHDQLFNSRFEVASIASLIEESAQLYTVENGQTDSYDSKLVALRLRSKATKGAVRARFDPRAKSRPARFVHFATHGLLDDVKPQFSGLLFSPDSDGDAFWHTFEIFNASIPAELVVLSGCKTALGKMVGGEGLVGLSRAFFYAGTSSLCASLWDVADSSSTVDLMTAFYRHLLQDRARDGSSIGKAEALRRAQLDLINLAGRTAHPFHWASFALIGNRN